MPSLSYGDDSTVPYDTSGILSNRDLYVNNNPIENFGISVDTYYKKLYNMYPVINNCIYRIMEYALGLTYELYHKWVDLKANSKEYDKVINAILKNDNERFRNRFGIFIRTFLDTSKYSDPSLILNTEDYISKVIALKAELENDNPSFVDNDISISVGCSHNEYPMIKDRARTFYSNYNSALAFVICPFLKSVENTISDSLVEIKQEVYIDINRLICYFAENFDPSNLPEFLEACEQNKEEYIKEGLNLYKNLPDKFSRKIILELFDNHENIQSNWSYFLKTIDINYNKILNSDDFIPSCIKLKHFNISLPENISNVIFKNDPSNRKNPTRRSLLEYNHFLDTLRMPYMSENSYQEEIGLALLCRSFTKMFQSSVLYSTFNKGNDGISFIEYTKDFYRKYSKMDLLTEANKIGDYNIKDFMSSLISEELKDSWPEKIYSSKLTNGENVYFMYCKIIRSTWITTAIRLYVLILLNSYSKEMNETNRSYSNKNIHNSIIRETNDLLLRELEVLKVIYICDMTSYKKYTYSIYGSNTYLRNLYNEITMSEKKNRYFLYSFDRLFKNIKIPCDISVFDEKVINTCNIDDPNKDIDEINLDNIFESIKTVWINNGILPIYIDDQK